MKKTGRTGGRNYFAEYGPALARNGWPPIRVQHCGKKPVGNGWQKSPIRLPEAERIARSGVRYGVGILTGNIVGLDNDYKDDGSCPADLFAALVDLTKHSFPDALMRIGNPAKPPLCVIRLEDDAQTDSQDLGKFQILGKGRQFVGYGIHPDTKREYRWVENFLNGAPHEMPLAEVPAYSKKRLLEFIEGVRILQETFGLSSSKSTRRQKTDDPANVEALRISPKYRKLIFDDSDPPVGYESRSEAVFAVLIELLRIGCSDDQIEAIFLDSTYPISAHIQDQAKPGDYLKRNIEKARKLATDPDIERINANHALAMVGGKAVILREHTDRHGIPLVDFGSVESFKQFHLNQEVERDGMRKPIPLGDYWMRHPRRRQYESVEFNPLPVGSKPSTDERHYNLWRGFGVEPKKGDCSKILAHLKNIVCKGNKVHSNWVEGWLAEPVQRPAQKSGTALVIRGLQGTGKSIIADYIRPIFGPHFVGPVAHPKQITGQFNGHMKQGLLLHVEEAFLADDRTGEAVIKNLITSPTHLVEEKGLTPISFDNYLRLLITTNHEWAVPVSMEGRRFAVFEISDRHRGDDEYFKALAYEMNHGGREALLYHLSQFDLSKVNLRQVPNTDALREQKVHSLAPMERWLHGILVDGQLPGAVTEPNRCLKDALYNDYIEKTKKQGGWRPGDAVALGTFLRKMISGYESLRRTVSDSGGRTWVCEFPSLADCRKAFDEKMGGQSITWPASTKEWEAL